MFGFSARSGLWEIRISCIMNFNYLKNHSRNLQTSFDRLVHNKISQFYTYF